MSFIIYPAIDLRAGKVVRLKEGNPARLTAYSDDPSETARRWLETGAGWLHVVNLDGAFGEGDDSNRQVLKGILQAARGFNAHIQFGGGMRSLDAIEAALMLGVQRVVLGTIAIEHPDALAEAFRKFGPDQIAVGIDAKDGLVRLRGWTADSGLSATDLALHLRTLGLRTVIFTDIRRDGLGSGLNIAATRRLADLSELDVIASGGVHTLRDVDAARAAGLAGVIIGRALYEGTIHLKDALKKMVVE
ncbi:MAG TPA: 1-(5-phosphoribosyl)-5-[(5-phosphoribosylamino)methylideneamino]imidazole-4-carboxamide isomerase [Anaerolineales bacterium]|nr:1-(5-phosphoribosyl)-5-[(5-phosphoribosylamino)methylideneamino]imidazole-4-carboxamide isomerase [Anaerolineales bacterium]